MAEPDPAPLPLTASFEGQAGAPVLVLGDSLGTSRAVWDPQVPALAEHFRLLRFELPGHGGSAAPAGPYTIADLGAGVLALLDQHGIERAAYCGISLGGMIGMWLAAEHPGRIAALGLVCSSAYLPPASAWLARADQVRTAGLASISGQSIGRWFTRAFAEREPGVTAAFAADLERTDATGYAGCCAAIAGMDLRSRLGSITAPTVVIAGEQDPTTPPDHGALIASGISGARLVVVARAAHLANVSSPDEVTAALLGHLGGNSYRLG
ncbi:MAG TPA: 3-oxoadipate enol-lactonase [Streptosporangiaceae bacterium]|nr:3-oxoadipate enol-lactonase [Streptosporangiaceae bacterium]